MRMLLIGAPGAGKGTQAQLIAERFGITHISSGDLLRKHVEDGTTIGRAAKHYLSRGDLVPDAIVMDMLRKPVVAASESGGYVLDGFPRTVDQAKAAYETASSLGVAVEVAIFLEVQPAELTRRLLARGRGQDDRPEVIEHRLRVFEEKTRPMLDYYAQRAELITVNGARPVPEVAWSITVQLQQLRRRTTTG
ncbi:MAG TPA: adenylate kinase [Mycobacteriales bacterium]|nr:adenylate kinase [Mycobacteriales bacterium]